MLLIDIGNTLRTGSRTGIQRVVRELGHGLKTADPGGTKLIAFDLGREAFVELTDPDLLRSGVALDAIPPASRRAFDLGAVGAGDMFLDIDSAWNEPLDRGALYPLLKARGVVLVSLHYDAIPVLFPELCHPDTVVRFAQHLAHQLTYSDHVLTISVRVDRDLKDIARRFAGRSVSSEVISLGADLASVAAPLSDVAFVAAFPELDGLRFMLGVGTVEPRKNHGLLLDAFDRLEAPDAGLVIVGRQGWMADEFMVRLKAHPAYGKRLFWHEGVEDACLRALYARAFVAVFPSLYEGFGLPAAEALGQGSATVCSDAGSLPEATAGHAELFPSGDEEALSAILARLYGDAAAHRHLRDKAAAYVAPAWERSVAHMRDVLGALASGARHELGAPLRQMVMLSIHPERLDLALSAARANLPFIDRIVVLTRRETKDAIAAVAGAHFPNPIILTDEAVAGGDIPRDHQARNSWLRKQLYRLDCIEANFLAADEDALALRPAAAEAYRQGGVHRGYVFLDDLGTWLAGSPQPTSFDRGVRNVWRLLREAGYPARGCASHMPQIVNKSLANVIFDRFVLDPEGPAYDEWSLYFNVAAQLFPTHFAFAHYATLGWPMRMGDWLPQITPDDPLFENYYPENYAAGGMFVGLDPLGDFEAKTARTLAALAQARHIETSHGQLALSVSAEGLAFAGGPVAAGKDNVRRILLINNDAEAVRGKLEYFLAEESGAPRGRETVHLGEVCWLPLLPPDRPGRYQLRFFLTLPSGARRETTAPLEVIADARQ